MALTDPSTDEIAALVAVSRLKEKLPPAFFLDLDAVLSHAEERRCPGSVTIALQHGADGKPRGWKVTPQWERASGRR